MLGRPTQPLNPKGKHTEERNGIQTGPKLEVCGRAGSSRPSCPEAHSRALKDGRMPTEPDGSRCAAKFVVLPLSWL